MPGGRRESHVSGARRAGAAAALLIGHPGAPAAEPLAVLLPSPAVTRCVKLILGGISFPR